MSFSLVENAVVAWVEAATGLTGKVILARQKAPQPALPFVSIAISSPGRPRTPHPMRIESLDLSRPAGSEFETRAVFEHERKVSIQAFTAATTGDNSASELLLAARTALGLESVLAGLRDAGLALIDPGDLRDLTTLVETGFQGRAVLDVRFLAASEAVERVGYVQTIGLTGKV